MTLQTINLNPRIASQVVVDREVLLSGRYSQPINTLLEERAVLVFRNISFTDDEQLAFAKTLGEIVPIGEKGIYKITLDQKENDSADLLMGTFCWHFDSSPPGGTAPARATMLSPRRLSEIGGETEFANTTAAYADLSEADKRAIDKLRVVHATETLQRTLFPNPTEVQLQRWRRQPPKTHPLVWTHKSGRKSLVLGLRATSVEGMDPIEGRALIDRLQTWTTQPQYMYRHEWKMGDLLIWDNTGVIHRVEPYPMGSGRMLSRTTLMGEEELV